MSAETLRRAAALMRERAEAALAYEATEGWWRAEPLREAFASLSGEDEAPVAGYAEDAEHIASWHPTVALAVASWLNACASVMEVAPTKHKGNALAVANAYLQETP